jgi:hypothetical protein
MANAILLDHYILPERGVVDLRLHWSFDIQITAAEARQKVDSWLLDEVSYMIGAGEPLLVVDGATVVWRVPAIFTATHIGEVGTAGSVDVDVQTGAMDITSDRKAVILQGAQALAQKMPPYEPRKTMPKTWSAKELQPTVTQSQGDPLRIIAASS